MPPKKKQKVQASVPSKYKPEPKKWTALPPDEKHREGGRDFHGNTLMSSNHSGGFPALSRIDINNADKRSFWKFAYHLQELIYLYHETGDIGRCDSFQEALDNMLDLSGHDNERNNTLEGHIARDKYGNYIGISDDDMGRDMVTDDVKCLRDIFGVGASTVKLIEEWIETGTMKRLEDMREKADLTILEKVRHSLKGSPLGFWGLTQNPEHLKEDYTLNFVTALGELAELYEKEDDARATAFRRAIIALEPQIINCVGDIEDKKLIKLKGVGKVTLEMFKEFIENGKIQRLEEMRRRPV